MVCYRLIISLLAVSLVAGLTIATAGAQDVPRMTKEELNEMLESTDLLILDVRRARDWDASEFKIKGAERKDPGKFDTWKDQLPKEKTLVLYCA